MMTELARKVSWDKFNKLRDCSSRKTPKSWIWTGFIMLGLPLLIIGTQVWSQQESDNLRFASKEEIVQCRTDQVKLDGTVSHMKQDLEEIKANQRETQADIKKILGFMRDGKK